MQTKVLGDQTKQNQSRNDHHTPHTAQAQFEDNRPELADQLQQQTYMMNCSRVKQLQTMQSMTAASTKEKHSMLTGAHGLVQREEEDEPTQQIKRNTLVNDDAMFGAEAEVNSGVLQRCVGLQDENGMKTLSSFDNSIRLDSEENPGTGDGGALSVFLQKTGGFKHRVVCLEWFNGLSKTGTELTAHLAVPHFRGMGPLSVIYEQAKSVMWPIKDAAIIEKMDFKQRFSSLEHKTVPLSESQKENKRNLIESEVGKTSDYSGLTADCKTWAEKVAAEAVI